MSKTLDLLVRYLGAGCIATLVHLAIFACLLPGCGPALSTFCAGTGGAGTAYYLNRHWVFAERQCNGLRFTLTAISQIASNTLIVGLLTDWGVPAYFAQLAAMTLVTVQGFTINLIWVFKHDLKRTHTQ